MVVFKNIECVVNNYSQLSWEMGSDVTVVIEKLQENKSVNAKTKDVDTMENNTVY